MIILHFDFPRAPKNEFVRTQNYIYESTIITVSVADPELFDPWIRNRKNPDLGVLRTSYLLFRLKIFSQI
jgi:hypothetical protein